MHARLWRSVVALVMLVVALVLVACGGDDADATETPETAVAPTATMLGAVGTPAAEGDLDLAFIDSMIPHHEGAVEMARLALEQAEHQEIKDLATAIISAQQREIDEMRAWRDAWFPGAPASGGMPGMAGMPGMLMSHEDMHMLETAEPFDEAFIDMMIVHHQAAIAMAERLLETTERPELTTLAQAIITAQRAEIEQMERWRAEWYGR